MHYKVLNSGSDGNCTIINDVIAIDLGVSYRKIGAYRKTIKLVLLTHEHKDHFNWNTARILAQNHPNVKFICMDYMVKNLRNIVRPKNIFVIKPNTLYELGICRLSAFNLEHDVPNVGYRIMIDSKKIIYATDTSNLDNVVAKNYDLYLIEGNYDYEETIKRYQEKTSNGEYSYELRAMKNHLSIDQFNEFIKKNNENGEVVMMHCHKEKHEKQKVESV